MSTSSADPSASGSRSPAEFWALARRIAHLGTKGVARLEFLRELSAELLTFSGCFVVNMWMTDVDQDYHWQMNSARPPEIVFKLLRSTDGAAEKTVAGGGLAQQIRGFINSLHGEERGSRMAHRSFRVFDDATRRRLKDAVDVEPQFAAMCGRAEFVEALLLPLQVGASLTGLMALSAASEVRFGDQDRFLYEQVAETVERAVINRRAQFRLRERIKELTCLHDVTKVVQRHSDGPESTLQAIVELLPPAMQFPELADASMSIDSRDYQAGPGGAAEHRLETPIVVNNRPRGMLAVSYRAWHPEFAAGPFLNEERDLLGSVAHEIAMFIERTETAAARASLAEQLRHADRLATIGQLAAGVAHELNEPLGNIMGFAQLLQKQPGLPQPAFRDAEQIVQAVLHGREIVKKLLLFSRQSDARRIELSLSDLVRDSLYFIEARCRHRGIDLRLELAESGTGIVANASEMTQVIVNLAVNAIQAMAAGGTLTIRTCRESKEVHLVVVDTGIGMDEMTRQQVFLPFFTTKDVGEGTGLGLSVVLGIISAHRGRIEVESEPGRGARFSIHLPASDENTSSQAGVP